MKKGFLKVLSNLFFGIGGIAFFVGGGLLHAVYGVDRMSGEFVGILGGVGCVAIGAVMKANVDEPEAVGNSDDNSAGDVKS